jgi:excisionase family DNA binding protein
MTKLWKTWEVAAALYVPVARVEGWIREGRVATVRTGRRTTLIPQAEVDRLIARSTLPARSKRPTASDKEPTPPKLHRAREVAAALHVPVARVRGWVARKKIPATDADSIPAAEVERFIARSTISAQPAAAPAPKDFNERG